MMAGHRVHPTDGELVLHFYGEDSQPAAIDRHLAGCDSCRTEYAAIAGTLGLVATPAAPERSDLYGLEVWQRVRPLLPSREPWWRLAGVRVRSIAIGAALALVIVGAFVAGRYWPTPDAPATATSRSASAPAEADARARAVAIVDHLEQSERMLLDLVHAEGPNVDVTSQQAWAADLVDANRLYREAAAQAGDATTASVLDDLERSLLDIVHAPSKLTPADLDDVRARLDAAALLFKLRVLSDELREREMAPAARRNTT
jgi:hypothetical protein